jgi:hypothetical protein
VGRTAGLHLVSAGRLFRAKSAQRERRHRRRVGAAQIRSGLSEAGAGTRHARAAPRRSAITPADAPDVETFIKQTRQPEFISSAYFLRFKFDEGRYALVGRETLEGRDVLRIEYYPQKLFADDDEERQRREERRAERGRRKERCVGACEDENDKSYNDEMQRLMNKASRVTLWVEPQSHQILKYTFDDLGWDFLPGQWLVRVESVRASMTMSQPFPDVWLPRGLEMNAAMAFAIGTVSVRYTLDYHDYRRAEVTSRIGIPGVR